jgi:hypothetical protein
MSLNIRDLHKEHPLVLAAHKLVKVHEETATLGAALCEVRDSFPEVEEGHLIALWVGINAKELEITAKRLIGMFEKEPAKAIATEFFYWWHNQPGNNTEQGFDQWWEEKFKKA